MAIPGGIQRAPAARRQRSATRVRHGVLGFTLALTAIAYLDRVCISTAAPAMKDDLGISDVQMGWVFSAFTLAYALFEVPSGWLADRFGARVMLTRIVVWWSAMTAATGLATGFASLLGARARAGLRPGADDGGTRRRGDAALGRRAAAVGALAPDVRHLRDGRRGVGGGVGLVVSRRSARTPAGESRRAGGDRPRSAGAARAGPVASAGGLAQSDRHLR